MSLIFAHNNWIRTKTLKETMLKELTHFPNAKFVISYNVEMSFKNFSEFDLSKIYFGPNNGHKLGSLNGAIYAMKNATMIADDNDIIVFSHDDVYLNDIDLFNKNILLMEKYEFVGRQKVGPFSTIDKPYIMLGSFITGKKGASIIGNAKTLADESALPKDNKNSFSPELYFGDIVKSLHSYWYVRDYDDLPIDELGYSHITKPRGWTE